MVKLVSRGWGTVAFLAVWFALSIAGDIVATNYAGGNGYGVWFINSAFDIVLYLCLGWRYFPLPFLVLFIGFQIHPADRFGSLGLNMLAEIPYVACNVAAALVTVGPLRVQFPLRTTRDVSLFAVTLCAVGPLLANASSFAVFCIADPHLWSQFATQVLRGTGADVTANIIFVPAIMQLLAWREPLVSEGAELGVKIDRAFVLGLEGTVAIVLTADLLGARYGYALAEFSILPLAWLAVRYGMRGAVLGLLAANVTATIAQVALHVSVNQQLEYQGFLIANALLAYLLGAFCIERQSLTNRLKRAAYYDQLTDLPNAGHFMEFLQTARGGPVTLAIADISDLRLLNEGIGRSAVDGLMVQFANRLREDLDDDAFIARVGSGEFAVATLRAGDPTAFSSAIQRLTTAPFPIGDSQIFVEVSVGATASPDAQPAGELLRQAELAVRRAKESSNRVVIYEHAVELGPPLLYAELHRAAERGEFVPFFQPIYRADRDTWQLAGGELLMRWRHPERGLLAPSEFIHLLERLSISSRVGSDLLEQGLRLAMQWRQTVPDFALWVNFFPRQVLDPQCSQHIAGALARCDAGPEMLVVEITERVVAADELAFTQLARELDAMGVRTAIDDFGSGSSSLARIREVPAQVLKIDKSFVNRSDVDYKAMTVATTVVRLAAELDLKVVAEGIENQAQADAMLAIGCDFGQGYALGHPVPAADFERALPRVLI
jgi:diguanylate cyclase (GGDEF)-like protein